MNPINPSLVRANTPAWDLYEEASEQIPPRIDSVLTCLFVVTITCQMQLFV